MDTSFYLNMLSIDTTSGRESSIVDLICNEIGYYGCSVLRLPVGDGTENILFSWGTPKVVFCSHMDTVPPFIAPRVENDVYYGRGTCDAKGQIFAMFEACKTLKEQGFTDFALLVVSGEETGSFGAKAFAKLPFHADYLVVGEPTDNLMASACKGTKAFEITIGGVPAHSGYPSYGVSAVDVFADFVQALRALEFPDDPVLGETTWNIGKLSSDNPQNILSPELSFRIYFRTTFNSDKMVTDVICSTADAVRSARKGSQISIRAFGGDTPAYYETIPGIVSKPISFGSDAPHLTNFTHKAICGPGSILCAHTFHEKVSLSDLQKAVDQYVMMYKHWMR